METTTMGEKQSTEKTLQSLHNDMEEIARRLHEVNRNWQFDRIADIANEIERFCKGQPLRSGRISS